jgi:PAS domain S-box-containing protein
MSCEERAMKATVDLDALFGAMGDAVVVCDTQGLVVLWNPAAERMFGFSPAEAMGKPMDEMIIPERLRKRHWEGYEKTMATGITRYGNDLLRVPAVDKAGRAMSIAFTVAMLFGPDGKVSAIAAVIRDETSRFNDERALRKRLAELEARVAAAP